MSLIFIFAVLAPTCYLLGSSKTPRALKIFISFFLIGTFIFLAEVTIPSLINDLTSCEHYLWHMTDIGIHLVEAELLDQRR